MNEAEIIRNAFTRAGSRSDVAISEITGMNYDKLHKRRLAPGRIGALSISELRLFLRHADLTDEEIVKIVRGK
ncbi:MAG: hypothetical protein IJH64_04835 [Oscillospiraceae bacterium]|nr:hypothetical protein [Oscillospiraceae bacterium]